jgi:Protein of unknown function (DUF3833)
VRPQAAGGHVALLTHHPRHPMKRRLLLAALSVASALTLGGCASQKLETYGREKPVLDLQQYFNGTLDAYGVFTDRSGTVVKRFAVVMDCSWVGNEGTLDEAFTYSDGSKQRRVWHLTRQADGQFTGRADDVVGQAVGESRGNAFHWSYTLSLPVDTSVYEVQFDDWMYLMNDKVMLNKATMSKFGIRLGEVTLSFAKR